MKNHEVGVKPARPYATALFIVVGGAAASVLPRHRRCRRWMYVVFLFWCFLCWLNTVHEGIWPLYYQNNNNNNNNNSSSSSSSSSSYNRKSQSTCTTNCTKNEKRYCY
jgi:hypothetical protein